MPVYLSKSDFKVAQTCAAKLYYKKLGYPSALDADEYMQFLADGGYMVEMIAKLLYSEGVEIGFDRGPLVSAEETMNALKAESVTLFEATLIFGNMLARVDILRKLGSRFELIEVKAKSTNTIEDPSPFRGARGGIKAGWQPYLEDVGFQTHILRELFPKAEIEPFLCLVDKAKSTTIDSIFSCFELAQDSESQGKFHRPTVRFTGNIEELRRNHFLAKIGVRSEVDELMPEIITSAARFAESVKDDVAKIQVPICIDCRDCEYRIETEPAADTKNGFKECWGELAEPSPHILDYYHVGAIGGRNTPLANTLIASRRVRMSDVQESDLTNSKGEIGPIAQRQRIQREYTLRDAEFVSDQLGSLLAGHPYPLHFVDFETSRTAVPYHAGMRPYEQVAFQWSCHTIREKNGTIEHSEWINVVDAWPNVEFAQSLRDQLGDTGTFYMWSQHEKTVLKEILGQMERYGPANDGLRKWLAYLCDDTDTLQFVDLCRIAEQHYFHPAMKGRLSIKYVMPAVWGSNSDLHTDPVFSKYFRKTANGTTMNPYETLASLPFRDAQTEEEAEEVVSEGVGAMRAYQEMLYGLSRGDAVRRDQWRRLLLQYCELDTAAMVMIWMHWLSRRV